MKKGVIAVLVLLLAGGAGAGAYYYYVYMPNQTGADGRVSSDSEDAVYVDSVSVLAGLGSTSSLIQRFAGVVEPQQTWKVKLENERSVKECLVKEGDEVKTGQKLFIYDTTEDEDKLAQAQIDLERYENEIASSKATKEQLEKEKKKASADDQLSYTTRILSEENSIKQSEYEYKSKELEIKQLKEKIRDAAVYCDIDGVVKSVTDPDSSGSMMDSSDSAYITVLEVGDYRIKGTVNEQNINQISEGMDVIVHSRVDDAVTWRGTISEINRDKGETNAENSYYAFSSGSDNGTSSTNYPFYVALESSDNMILGQHVYLEPDVGQEEKKDGIWLDDFYFTVEEDGSAWVWAASAQNVLEKRTVTLGEYDEDLASYEVLEGLTAEDYITAPFDEITEGLPVIYNDASADTSFYDDSGFEDMGYDDGGFSEEDEFYGDAGFEGDGGFSEDGEFYEDAAFEGVDGFSEDMAGGPEGVDYYDANAEDDVYFDEGEDSFDEDGSWDEAEDGSGEE